MKKLPSRSPDEQPEGRTASRKAEHLQINVERDVAGKGIDNGLGAWQFVHRALPEIDFDEPDPSTEIFGRRLRAPLLISCMTGGAAEAQRINARLARVAQRHGIAMGLGSGRALIESPNLLETFDVRGEAPDILIFANIGAVQLNKGYGIEECRRLMQSLRADALVLHLNPLQEALQPEGDTCFRGLLRKIADLCDAADFPVVVKEVGWGIAAGEVRALFAAGVAAVDVAGAGGTSWSEVERHRIEEPWRARVAGSFADWGIPTARCLIESRAVAPNDLIFASGGIKTGVEIAKALALGADLVGIAGPFLRAAHESENAADELARALIEEIRIVMFCIGARTPVELRGRLRNVS